MQQQVTSLRLQPTTPGCSCMMCFLSDEENWLIPIAFHLQVELSMGSMLESDHYNNLDLNKSISSFWLFFFLF